MSTLNQKRIDQFVKEFPFLPKVINTDLETCRVSSVKVQVADSETLFIKPRFCLDPHYISSDDNKFVGHVSPTAYAVAGNGELLGIISWDYETPHSFLKDLLVEKHSQPVKYLVVVMVYTWWHYVDEFYKKGLSTYVGAFSHYDYAAYIFKEPKQGFKALRLESNLASNVRIDDLSSIAKATQFNYEAKRAVEEISLLRETFKSLVGEALWKHIENSKLSGMSGMFGSTELRVFCTAGRVMITFCRGSESFTLLGDESDWRRTGIQSMRCTVDHARSMVLEVTGNWNLNNLHVDSDVWFG